MINHVSARCEPYRFLFPSANIEAILSVPETVRIASAGSASRRRNKPMALDLRRLLGAPHVGAGHPCIRLDWISSDSNRRITLLVDAVDGILNEPQASLTTLPLLPQRVLSLCDGIVRDPDGACRMGIRLDVEWPLAGWGERRAWARALVVLE